MPGRILGIDIGRAAQVTSPLVKSPLPKRRKSNSDSPVTDTARGSMEHFKRPSLAGLTKHSSDKRDKHHERKDSSTPKRPLRLDIVAESPPAMFMDDPQTSSGALYSCKIKMHVIESEVIITSFHLKLNAIASTKRPVADRCADCTTQTTVLKDWNFISEKTTFDHGVHEFPASYLIPGHLPATTHGHIGKIDYNLVTTAINAKGEKFEHTKPLIITRAIRPGAEKHSVRVFPPTNMALNVTIPSVVHPIGDFQIYARMSGMTIKKDDTQTRWRLRKLLWKIEEHETTISPACPKHVQKIGGEGKGIAHEHTRDIGEAELKSGWKTDFDEGQLEGEFPVAINTSMKPNCDVNSPDGLQIKHTLILECIISEEWAPNKKPQSATPTGAARVLRAQFNLTVTERTGMGIAWDDEMPPMYEDVPASPPRYLQVKDYEGEDLNEDVDHLHLE